jgi:hypothetical protein
MPLYKKKESLTSKYSKIPNLIYCEVEIEIKKELTKACHS